MAFRIRPDKPFTKELRAAARGQLDAAVTFLQTQPEGPHAAIHDARKAFKRLRALYRFARFDAAQFRRLENDRLRDVSRLLSSTRDAAALVETLEWLQETPSTRPQATALIHTRKILIERRDRMTGHETGLPDRIDTAVEACAAATAALGDLWLDDDRKACARRVARVWRKELSRAKSVVEECDRNATPENFHELRKQSQIYRIHLSLLRDLWPSAMKAKRAEASVLVKLLGHEHDLSVMIDKFNSGPELLENGERRALMLALVRTRQSQLREEALKKAATVFSDTPKCESRIIASLWR